MRDKDVFYEFAGILCPLLETEMPLPRLLEVISQAENAGPRVKTFSAELLARMEEGFSFGDALELAESCNVIHRYCMIIASAEEAGNLKSAMNLIFSIESQSRDVQRKILSVSVYPLMVVVLVFAGTAALLCNHRMFGLETVPPDSGRGFAFAALFLLVWCGALMIFMKKLFSVSPWYLFFSVASVLLDNGFSVYHTISLGARYIPSLESVFAKVRRELKNGMPLFKACSLSGSFKPEWLIQIELARDNKDLAAAFVRTGKILEKEAALKREKFLSLIEPVLLFGTGVYVLIVLESGVMPFITNFGGII